MLVNNGLFGLWEGSEENAVCQWRSDVNVMAAKVFNFPLNCFQLSKESSLVPHTNSTRLGPTRLDCPRLKPDPTTHYPLYMCVFVRLVMSVQLNYTLKRSAAPESCESWPSVSPISPARSCHSLWKGPRRIVIIVKKLQQLPLLLLRLLGKNLFQSGLTVGPGAVEIGGLYPCQYPSLTLLSI